MSDTEETKPVDREIQSQPESGSDSEPQKKKKVIMTPARLQALEKGRLKRQENLKKKNELKNLAKEDNKIQPETHSMKRERRAKQMVQVENNIKKLKEKMKPIKQRGDIDFHSENHHLKQRVVYQTESSSSEEEVIYVKKARPKKAKKKIMQEMTSSSSDEGYYQEDPTTSYYNQFRF